MSSARMTILVTGATGKQGGAVARCLLELGHDVRFLTRDPGKPAAAELVSQGGHALQGDLGDATSVAHAVAGAQGVFSVQNFWEAGYDAEVQQGKNLADAAKAAGVEHFVYSSVGGADRRSGVSHFESKWEIEEYVRSLGLPATILRPVFYMENILAPDMWAQIEAGTLSVALNPETPLQMIAVRDIGAVACLAFSNPAEWIGRELETAGDELTMPQAAEVMARVLGHPVNFVQMPMEQLRAFSEEYAEMMEWFIAHGYECDIPALRKLHPGLLTLEQWMHKAGLAKG